MVAVCGNLPEDMEEKWEQMFGENEEIPDLEPYKKPIQQYLTTGIEEISGAEARVITDFLASMMQIDPNDRVSPTQLLKHRWLSEDTTSRNNPCVCGNKK